MSDTVSELGSLLTCREKLCSDAKARRAADLRRAIERHWEALDLRARTVVAGSVVAAGSLLIPEGSGASDSFGWRILARAVADADQPPALRRAASRTLHGRNAAATEPILAAHPDAAFFQVAVRRDASSGDAARVAALIIALTPEDDGRPRSPGEAPAHLALVIADRRMHGEFAELGKEVASGITSVADTLPEEVVARLVAHLEPLTVPGRHNHGDTLDALRHKLVLRPDPPAIRGPLAARVLAEHDPPTEAAGAIALDDRLPVELRKAAARRWELVAELAPPPPGMAILRGTGLLAPVTELSFALADGLRDAGPRVGRILLSSEDCRDAVRLVVAVLPSYPHLRTALHGDAANVATWLEQTAVLDAKAMEAAGPEITAHSRMARMIIESMRADVVRLDRALEASSRGDYASAARLLPNAPAAAAAILDVRDALRALEPILPELRRLDERRRRDLQASASERVTERVSTCDVNAVFPSAAVLRRGLVGVTTAPAASH